jgi:hypothetical protein
MNDPHVVRLKYKLVTGDSVSYNSPPPVVFSDPGFDLKLENGILTVDMKEHFTTAGSADERLRPTLRAWEIQVGLFDGRDALKFEFDGSEIVDRNPPPPGSAIAHAVGVSEVLGVSDFQKAQVVRNQYPNPPTSFKASPLVELLWSRLQQHLDGKEFLTGTGFACLTLIEAQASSRKGRRKKASVQYKIHIDVLKKLGELTADVGDELSARKFEAPSTKRPHTPAEQDWILEAIKLLIARVGEYDFDPAAPLKQITLADLPKV